ARAERKDAVGQAAAAARPSAGGQPEGDEPSAALARANLLDNLLRHGERLLAGKHKPVDPESGVDGAPAVAGEIERDEKIAGKQRALHHLLAPRVAARARIARQGGGKALAAQVEGGAPLRGP